MLVHDFVPSAIRLDYHKMDMLDRIQINFSINVIQNNFNTLRPMDDNYINIILSFYDRTNVMK